jgi:hypothetical protein
MSYELSKYVIDLKVGLLLNTGSRKSKVEMTISCFQQLEIKIGGWVRDGFGVFHNHFGISLDTLPNYP